MRTFPGFGWVNQLPPRATDRIDAPDYLAVDSVDSVDYDEAQDYFSRTTELCERLRQRLK